MYLTTSCDSIRCSRIVPGGMSNEVSASVKVDILMPKERCLREFAELNIALNWKRAGLGDDLLTGYRAVVRDFISDFKGSKLERAEEIAKGEWVPPSAGWDFSLSSVITWNSGNYFSYRSSVYTYFGGVHPDVWFRNGTYSYRLGRQLRVSDLFEKRNLLAVARLIRRGISENESCSDYLREKMTNEVTGTYADYAGDVDADGRGDSSEPCVTENFMIVEDGVVWTYNEYEISSYSEGHTDVLVPWKWLAPLLRSRELIDNPKVKGVFERMRDDAREEERVKQIGDLEFF